MNRRLKLVIRMALLAFGLLASVGVWKVFGSGYVKQRGFYGAAIDWSRLGSHRPQAGSQAGERLARASKSSGCAATKLGSTAAPLQTNGPDCFSFTNRTSANGLGTTTVNRVYAEGLMVYGATNFGLSISTDGGVSFSNRTTANGLLVNRVRDVYAVGTTVYAATEGGGLSVSTNGGASFTLVSAVNENFVRGVYAVGTKVYAATA